MTDDTKPDRALKQEVILLGSCLLIAFVLGGIGLLIFNLLGGCPFYDAEKALEWFEIRFEDGDLAAEEFSIECTAYQLRSISSPTSDDYDRAYTPHARRLISMIRRDPSDEHVTELFFGIASPYDRRRGRGGPSDEAIHGWLDALPDDLPSDIRTWEILTRVHLLATEPSPDWEVVLSEVQQADLDHWAIADLFGIRVLALQELGRDEELEKFVRGTTQKVVSRLKRTTSTGDALLLERLQASQLLYSLTSTNTARNLFLELIDDVKPEEVYTCGSWLMYRVNGAERQVIVEQCSDQAKADRLRLYYAAHWVERSTPEEALLRLAEIGRAAEPDVWATAMIMKSRIMRGMTPPDVVGAKTAMDEIDFATITDTNTLRAVKEEHVLLLWDSDRTNEACEAALTSFTEEDFAVADNGGSLAARCMIYVGLTNEALQHLEKANRAAGVRYPEKSAALSIQQSRYNPYSPVHLP